MRASCVCACACVRFACVHAHAQVCMGMCTRTCTCTFACDWNARAVEIRGQTGVCPATWLKGVEATGAMLGDGDGEVNAVVGTHLNDRQAAHLKRQPR